MERHKVLLWCVIGAVGLLIGLALLQEFHPAPLALPAQWLWVCLVPVILGIVAGGYITKFKAGDLGEAEFRVPVQNLREVSNSGSGNDVAASESWVKERAEEYKRNYGLVLVHAYERSKERGQLFDVFVYLARHAKNSAKPERESLDDVKKVEFFFGESWKNTIFEVERRSGKPLGIRSHAFGTFLALCRVTFEDPSRAPVLISRYIDFEMLSESAKR